MALRVAVASAVVSRNAGRRRHRLGAFLCAVLEARCISWRSGCAALLALVSSIIFVDAMLFTALTPLVPGYAEEFDLSKTGAGLLVGAFGAGALFGGVPGGLAAARFGPKSAVIGGLVLLGIASLAFAAADSASTLGSARFVQGLSSTVTWAGALAWIAVAAPRSKRGEVIGTAFGAAIFGAVLGPMFGGIAELGRDPGVVHDRRRGRVRVRGARARSRARRPARSFRPHGVRRAFRDLRFLGGLWLNTLPACLFGMLVVLAPLALDEPAGRRSESPRLPRRRAHRGRAQPAPRPGQRPGRARCSRSASRSRRRSPSPSCWRQRRSRS